MRPSRRDACLLIGGLPLFAAGAAVAIGRPAAPSDGLARADKPNIDPDAVLAFLDDMAAQDLELDSVMLWRNGAVAAEGWWWPYRPEIPHMLHSATKSFTGTGVGIAIGEGLVALDDPVLKFFPGRVAAPSANLAAMTVESLLTQTSGHAIGISGSSWRPIKTSWVDEFFKVSVPFAPGAKFAYSSATSYMLSAIINQVTDQSMDAYLRPRLFQPLGMRHVRWDVGPEGVNPGGNGLSTTTADFLKLGVLHLQGGRWNGRQVVPTAWTDAVARPTHGNPYSYQWWLAPDDLGYYAAGKFGQFCYVLPRLDAVLAMTAGVADNLATRERMHATAFRHAARMCPPSKAPAAASGRTRMATRLESLRVLPPFTRSSSPMAQAVNGRAFACAENADGVRSVGVRIAGDQLDFTLVDPRGTHVVRNGLADWTESRTTMTGGYLHHEYEPETMQVVAGARWLAPDRLEMTWQFVESGFRDVAVLTFAGEIVRYDRRTNVNSGPLARPTITGRAT